ncbi:MAG TPA: hypothetical protein VGA37_06855 [Gemmatimonadales bacterium]
MWYRTVLDVDPVPLLERLETPTLWLFGDPALDRFGPVETSVERLQLLRDAGKPYHIHVYEGADHNLDPSSWTDDLWSWLDRTVGH